MKASITVTLPAMLQNLDHKSMRAMTMEMCLVHAIAFTLGKPVYSGTEFPELSTCVDNLKVKHNLQESQVLEETIAAIVETDGPSISVLCAAAAQLGNDQVVKATFKSISLHLEVVLKDAVRTAQAEQRINLLKQTNSGLSEFTGPVPLTEDQACELVEKTACAVLHNQPNAGGWYVTDRDGHYGPFRTSAGAAAEYTAGKQAQELKAQLQPVKAKGPAQTPKREVAQRPKAPKVRRAEQKLGSLEELKVQQN